MSTDDLADLAADLFARHGLERGQIDPLDKPLVQLDLQLGRLVEAARLGPAAGRRARHGVGGAGRGAGAAVGGGGGGWRRPCSFRGRSLKLHGSELTIP